MKYLYSIIFAIFPLMYILSGCGGSQHEEKISKKYRDLKISRFKTISDHTKEVFSVSFSPYSDILISAGYDQTVRLWDIDENLKATLVGHSMLIGTVDFSPDGQFVISGSCVQPDTGEIMLWDVATCEGIWTIKEPQTGPVYAVEFSPDGHSVAYGCQMGIKLRSLATGELIWGRTRTPSDHRSISFSPDGKLLASACLDPTIRMWDTASGDITSSWEAHERGVSSVLFNPDGKILASASLGEIKLWNVASRKEVRTLLGHDDWVFSLSFSPNGALLASGCEHCGIKLWDVNSGKEIETQIVWNPPIYSVCFNYDGSLLAGASDNAVDIYRLSFKL